MPRAITIGAAIALLATPALAAPGLGSSSWTVSSNNASARAEAGETSVLASLLGLFNINIEKKKIVGASSDPASKPPVNKEACDQSKEAGAEKAEKKKQAQAGPEPVYLAF
jgi:hypothetical protein